MIVVADVPVGARSFQFGRALAPIAPLHPD
jgi:hypothetical protein